MWDFYMSELYANMEDQLDDGVTGPGNALTDKQHVLLEEKVKLKHEIVKLTLAVWM